jgi:hypothetical protein
VNEQEFGRIGSALSGITSGGRGGSFAYSPDQIRDLVKEWTDLAKDYEGSLANADLMANVEGPGTEFASQSHASVARESGRAYLESLKNRIEYCYGQAQKSQDALDSYLGQEHRSVRDITGSGPQEGI